MWDKARLPAFRCRDRAVTPTSTFTLRDDDAGSQESSLSVKRSLLLQSVSDRRTQHALDI